jgi:hypothetical protein
VLFCPLRSPLRMAASLRWLDASGSTRFHSSSAGSGRVGVEATVGGQVFCGVPGRSPCATSTLARKRRGSARGEPAAAGPVWRDGGTPHVEKHEDAVLRRCPACNAKLWPKAIPRPMRFHDLRHTAATLMLRAGVDAHRVQRILRHASVTTTTGTYGHLALDDLRDAVTRIGPKNPAPFADRLLTDQRGRFRRQSAPRIHPAMTACSRVSRLGIEPRTLGLKGRCSTS